MKHQISLAIAGSIMMVGCVNSPVDIVNAKDLSSYDAVYVCNAYAETGKKNERLLSEVLGRGAITQLEASQIKSGVIAEGMSEMAVICAWGIPDDLNGTMTSGTTFEQYVYSFNGVPSVFFYFEDGYLTGWQN